MARSITTILRTCIKDSIATAEVGLVEMREKEWSRREEEELRQCGVGFSSFFGVDKLHTPWDIVMDCLMLHMC
jgi:hypothetical protein